MNRRNEQGPLPLLHKKAAIPTKRDKQLTFLFSLSNSNKQPKKKKGDPSRTNKILNDRSGRVHVAASQESTGYLCSSPHTKNLLPLQNTPTHHIHAPRTNTHAHTLQGVIQRKKRVDSFCSHATTILHLFLILLLSLTHTHIQTLSLQAEQR